MELREFIEARLAEDEAWARGASAPYQYADEGAKPPDGGVHWTWAVREDWTPITVDPSLDEYVGGEANYGCRVQLVTVEKWPSGTHQMSNYAATDIIEFRATWAGHIARHDPARVLRDVEAKRLSLMVATVMVATLPLPPGIPAKAAHLEAIAHDTERKQGEMWLKLLALPYVDHPDYDPSWSPENVVPHV